MPNETDSIRRTEDGFPIHDIHVLLGLWSKHPALHGYIATHFGERIADQGPIYLEVKQLKQLMLAVKKPKDLPGTQGPGFGTSPGDQDQIDKDLKIFTDAHDWLVADHGLVTKVVIYQATW